MKIKKGDTVIVRIGKDKDKKGVVEHVDAKKSMVTVTGLNVYKRHRKKKSESEQSAIVDIVKPMAVAKVSLVCPSCGKPTRVGYKTTKDEKVRVCKKCEQRI